MFETLDEVYAVSAYRGSALTFFPIHSKQEDDLFSRRYVGLNRDLRQLFWDAQIVTAEYLDAPALQGYNRYGMDEVRERNWMDGNEVLWFNLWNLQKFIKGRLEDMPISNTHFKLVVDTLLQIPY